MSKPNDIPQEDYAQSALSALSDLRDTLGEATSEDREQLRAWEKMIKGHSLRKAWLQNPISQEVFDLLAKRVATMNLRLSTEEGMSEEARRGIFSEKRAYTWLLTLFSDAKDDTVLKSLETEIQERTKAFEDFNHLS